MLVSAVLVAPVIEEYLFRGLLQGWLERLRRAKGGTTCPVGCLVFGSGPLTGGHEPDGDRWPLRTGPIVRRVAFGAFARILHLPHGPDWIPLFVLALGLGYLYRQTHRLLPAIVVHFLLNACSLLMLLVS